MRKLICWVDMGAWNHLHMDRIKAYYDMQVWDAVSDARIQFNTSMLDQASEDLPIAWMIENVHLQNGIIGSMEDHKSNGASVDLFEKTKVAKIFYENNTGEDPNEMDLSDWPTVELSSGRILKTRLLVRVNDD
jgi:ubiquinone biosynthesis monooxygenase Coq6